jgi:hypothetical protein
MSALAAALVAASAVALWLLWPAWSWGRRLGPRPSALAFFALFAALFLGLSGRL